MRLTGIMCIIAVGGMLSGCALRDSDYYAASRASDDLWGDRPFELIDWNFPTSRNQPPIEAPRRIRLDRTAIGVTWATRNPLPLSDNLAPLDAPPALEVKANDAAARSQAAARGDGRDPGPSAADREPRAAR